jgi:ABC-type bacteriocin/lantibiotic exporter with double-glycine peptidase domain
MHPAWAGAGGNWPAIDEIFDPKVVKQKSDLSCVAACGEMLLKDRGINISQAVIEELIGLASAPEFLAGALNELNPDTSGQWKGAFLNLPGATQFQVFETLNTTGSWAAVLWEKGVGIGHMIIVDGLDEDEYVMIRDPWQGTRYRMIIDDFLQYWSQSGVYWLRK